jgi:hypothetical protein
MSDAIIKTRCEDCGASVTFPGTLRDTVQECPECGSYVDVIAEAAQKPYDWKKEHQRLWAALVPKQGQADTLQGEIIRIVGKLTDEAYRNGNRNWDTDCERMWRFVGAHLDDPETFTEEERELIGNLVEEIIEDKDCPDVLGDGSAIDVVNEKAVDWCMAHPDPIPHKKDPTLKR